MFKYFWVAVSCMQVNVNYKQQLLEFFHTNEPFNFNAIFHSKWILLHKSELYRNPEKQNQNLTEQIVLLFFCYFGDLWQPCWKWC